MSMICLFLAKELNSYINFVENTLVNIKKVTQFVSEEKQDETEYNKQHYRPDLSF